MEQHYRPCCDFLFLLVESPGRWCSARLENCYSRARLLIIAAGAEWRVSSFWLPVLFPRGRRSPFRPQTHPGGVLIEFLMAPGVPKSWTLELRMHELIFWEDAVIDGR